MGFQIAPMVDVVFVLLLFFMASAGTQIIEKELSIKLPSGSKSTAGQTVSPIIIEISAEGQVSINNTQYGSATDKNLTPLREFLKQTVEEFGGQDPVIVRPTGDTRQERVVDVLSACAKAGVKNLTFG